MTRNDIGFHSIRHSIAMLVWVAISLFIMWHFRLDNILIDRIGELWAAGVALLLVVALIFLANLFIAPTEIQKEADNEIDDLKKQIDNKEARQNAIDALWILRKSGVELRNKSVSSDEDFNSWQSEFWSWRSNTLDKARVVSVNLQNWLDILDRTVPRPANVLIHNPEHDRLLRVASTILNRLQQYLEGELFREE